MDVVEVRTTNGRMGLGSWVLGLGSWVLGLVTIVLPLRSLVSSQKWRGIQIPAPFPFAWRPLRLGVN